MRQNLSTVYRVLFLACEISLRSRLETEPGYQDMIKSRRHCAIDIHKIIRKNCNGSACVVVEDVIGTMFE